jgi:hypothetical protein
MKRKKVPGGTKCQETTIETRKVDCSCATASSAYEMVHENKALSAAMLGSRQGCCMKAVETSLI